MSRGPWLTAAFKAEVWRHWQAGETCSGLKTLGVDSRYLAPPPGGLESLKPQAYLGLRRTMNEWIKKQFARP